MAPINSSLPWLFHPQIPAQAWEKYLCILQEENGESTVDSESTRSWDKSRNMQNRSQSLIQQSLSMY